LVLPHFKKKNMAQDISYVNIYRFNIFTPLLLLKIQFDFFLVTM